MRPVLLTVDDDAQVVRAIERDLRQHYGSKISRISEEQLREILEEVRKLRRKRKRLAKEDNRTSSDIENEELEHQNEEEIPYIG